jgi:hypothetical protein
MIRRALMLVCGLAAPALGQSYTSDCDVTLHMAWSEADAAGDPIPNPNGILEPGEHALIRIDTVSITNQGGIAHFAPALGTFTSGTILGFASSFLDIAGTGGTVGQFNIDNPPANGSGTSRFGVRPTWRLFGNGYVNRLSDGIFDLQFGQFTSAPAAIVTDNPVTNVFRMLWTPSAFSTRTAHFQITGAEVTNAAIGEVYLGLDASLAAAARTDASHTHVGSVSIPIAPAPPTLLLAAAAVLRRRRRRGAQP